MLDLAKIAVATDSPLANVEAYWPLIAAELDSYGIGDDPVLIAAAATVGVETWVPTLAKRFAPIDEMGSSTYFEKMYGYQTKRGAELGNVGPGDGAFFHGRGFIQITGRDNYHRYSLKLGMGDELVQHPERALEAGVAARLFGAYFSETGIRDHSQPEYPFIAIPELARMGRWLDIRRVVNGGLNGAQRYLAIVNALRGGAPGV